jgi:hypothetical protein
MQRWKKKKQKSKRYQTQEMRPQHSAKVANNPCSERSTEFRIAPVDNASRMKVVNGRYKLPNKLAGISLAQATMGYNIIENLAASRHLKVI